MMIEDDRREIPSDQVFGQSYQNAAAWKSIWLDSTTCLFTIHGDTSFVYITIAQKKSNRQVLHQRGNPPQKLSWAFGCFRWKQDSLQPTLGAQVFAKNFEFWWRFQRCKIHSINIAILLRLGFTLSCHVALSSCTGPWHWDPLTMKSSRRPWVNHFVWTTGTIDENGWQKALGIRKESIRRIPPIKSFFLEVWRLFEILYGSSFLPIVHLHCLQWWAASLCFVRTHGKSSLRLGSQVTEHKKRQFKLPIIMKCAVLGGECKGLKMNVGEHRWT